MSFSRKRQNQRKNSAELRAKKGELKPLVPKTEEPEKKGWNFLGFLSLFIYGPGHIAMEVLNGIDQPVFTPIRIATVFSILLGCSIAGIFANVFIPMFIIGAIMGILYAWVKFKNEKQKFQLTSYKNLQPTLESLHQEITDTILKGELEKAAIDFYKITDDEEKKEVKAQIIDGQIRIKLPSRFTTAEPTAQPPPPYFLSFKSIWRSIEDFYKRHNIIDRIWTGLTNYSMYYWIFWFSACAISGGILAVPFWWVLVGALIAQWVLPFIINLITATWLKSSQGLPIKEMFVEKKSEEQKIAALEKEAAEKVIPHFLASLVYPRQTPPETELSEKFQLPPFAQTIIDEPLNNLVAKRLSASRTIIAGLTGFFHGWINTVFAWWPISDGILYAMTLTGMATTAPAFIVTSLAFTVAGFTIAVIIGGLRMFSKIGEMREQINAAAKLAQTEKDRFSEKLKMMENAGKIPPQMAIDDPNLKRIIDDDSFLEYLQTLRIEPHDKMDTEKTWIKTLLNIGKMAIGCFGTGVLIVRFLFLPGTIGAIATYGFTALAVNPVSGIVFAGALGASGAWLAIAITAIVVGVIWASIKITEHYLQKNLERQKQLAEATPTRLKMLKSYLSAKTTSLRGSLVNGIESKPFPVTPATSTSLSSDATPKV